MEEIKAEVNPIKKEEHKELSIKDKAERAYDAIFNNAKTKELKLLRKAKVRGRKAKKGWMGVLKVDENNNITGEKQKIDDSVFVTKDGKYHATKHGEEVLMWNGKFPVLIQQSWKEMPVNLRKDTSQKDETYGQKYIMARMLNDTIKVKAKAGSWVIWIVVAIVAVIAFNYFKGGA